MYTRESSRVRTGAGSRRAIRYYRDPMHPSYTSNKPGIAPDCGMALEPVYETADVPAPPRRGRLRISPEKQQVMGVVLGCAEKGTLTKTTHAVGRVDIDESRI